MGLIFTTAYLFEGDIMNDAQEFIPAQLNAVGLYSEFRGQLETLKAESKSLVFDYNSPKGNKEARSHIFSLRKVKTALENARKEAKAAALEYGRLVDSKAHEIRDELEALIEHHDAPIREIEQREAAIKAAIAERVNVLNNWRTFPADLSAEHWQDELAMVEAFVIDDSLGEAKFAAAYAKDEAMAGIKVKLAARRKYESEQAELAKLRAEAEARARKDREDQIAREAAERATQEAEAEAERKRQNELRAQQERDRLQQEEANRQQLALERAQREKAEAEARAAKAEKEAKEKAERELALQQQREREAAEKREANKKHQAAINNAAVSGLVTAGLTEEMAKLAVTAIAKREIPHVHIAY